MSTNYKWKRKYLIINFDFKLTLARGFGYGWMSFIYCVICRLSCVVRGQLLSGDSFNGLI